MYKTLNPIEDWYSSDERIRRTLDQLSTSGMTVPEQAAAAFESVADEFDLPKYPENVTEDHYRRFSELGVDEPRSVFEENAILRYLEPDDDPRGLAMLALYNVHHGIQMP